MAKAERSKATRKRSAKLTDAERHVRFVEVAKEVGASNAQTDFDDAFKKVAKLSPSSPKKRNVVDH